MITRYEIKFRINHDQKVRFLQAARFGLDEDPHGENACYRVSSVYFDSPGFNAYWEKIDGVDVRRKVRLRYYGEVDDPADVLRRPCFLEIKHRLKDCVYKQRIGLTSEGVRLVLEDARNMRDVRQFTVPDGGRELEAVAFLEQIQAASELEPANVISYLREAWIGRVDNRLRVTFDQLAHVYNPRCHGEVGAHTGLPVMPTGHYVMEVKFNETFPRWIRDIVAEQNLLPRRFSKYAAGIEALHDIHLRQQSNLWTLDSEIGTALPEETPVEGQATATPIVAPLAAQSAMPGFGQEIPS